MTKNRLVYGLASLTLSLLSAVFRILPDAASHRLGRWLGLASFRFSTKRRGIALNNLKHALGAELSSDQLEILARESFANLGIFLAEFFSFPSLDAEKLSRLVEYTGEENLRTALSEGKGVLLLSAHLGNWDLLAASLAARGYPISLITKVTRISALNRMWMGYREAAGIKIFLGSGSMGGILRQLKSGGIVGFVLDQNALLEDGVFVPFFGRAACTLSSLAVLARRIGAPVIPVYTFREGGRHRVVIEEPIITPEIVDRELDVLKRTEAYTSWTEKVIREHPEQWTWLHDRWRTRPPDDSDEPVQGPTSNVQGE